MSENFAPSGRRHIQRMFPPGTLFVTWDRENKKEYINLLIGYYHVIENQMSYWKVIMLNDHSIKTYSYTELLEMTTVERWEKLPPAKDISFKPR